jgi:hypothetical protein
MELLEDIRESFQYTTFCCGIAMEFGCGIGVLPGEFFPWGAISFRRRIFPFFIPIHAWKEGLNEILASDQIGSSPRLEVAVRGDTEDGVLGW